MDELARPLYPYSFSLNLPEDQVNELHRENIISVITKYFANGKNVVCLDGEEGIGKSTILKQFVISHPENSFSTFINPVRGLASPEDFVLHDLFDQFFWFVEKTEKPTNQNIDEERYVQMRYRVKREQKNFDNISYYIVDGLEFIDNQDTLKKIIKLLPLGEPGIRVIFSIEQNKLEALIPNHSNISIVNLPIYPFTVDETAKVFRTKMSDDELRRVWDTANKGVPGKLKDIFRIIVDNNLTAEEAINNIDQISVVHEIDWRKLQTINDDLLNKTAAFIALDDKVFTKETLSQFLDISEIELIQKIKKVSFLTVLQNGEIHFTSNSSRIFFSRKLSDYKNIVINENIKYLLRNQNTLEALIGLPKYYSTNSNYDGVLNILTKDYFPKLIKISQTLTSASSSLSLGFVAAKKSGADQKLLDFSLYSSLINNVEGLHIWKSEIEARIEMGDYENAVKLANSALLHEDRLKFLAKIARIKKKKQEAIEDSLQEQINHLYKQIDIKNLGDKAIAIAADLFYVNPSLALNLIDGTTHKANQNVNDWLLSKITLAALESKQTVDSDKVSKLVTNQQAREFSSSLSRLFGSYSFDEILNEISKLSRPREKVLLLRFWIVNNQQNINLGKAICQALDTMINDNSMEFADASLLADLIAESHSLKLKDEKLEVVNRLHKFKDEAKKLSYTVDYFKFMAHAIRLRITIEHDMAMGWFYELKNEIDKIQDRVIRAECLAILNNCLHEIRGQVDKRRHGFLFESLNSQLKNYVIDIYNCSAYHFDNLQDVVWYLAFYDFKFAVEVALKANTTDRRDSLLYRIFDSYVTSNLKAINIDALSLIYNSINDSLTQEACIRVLLEDINSKKDLVMNDKVVGFILNSLQQAKSLPLQGYLQCLLAVYLNRDKDKNKELIKSIYNNIGKNWDSLDSDVSKIEIGFLICSMLSDTDKEIATEYLKKADELKKNIWPDSINTISIYSHYTKLLIRSFSGLIKGRHFDEALFLKVSNVISAIPIPVLRINLWNYFATLADVKGDLNLRSRIFNEYIRPAFESLTDKAQQDNVLILISYQFFVHNPIATKQKVEKLSNAQREDSLMNIILYILYQRIPDEPYDDDENGIIRTFKKTLNYDDLVGVCELMDKLEIDVHIYSCIEAISKAAIDLKTTVPQRQGLLEKLTKITDEKLPNLKYIRHPGYKIISVAQLLKLEKDSKKHSEQLDILVNLIDKQVPNISDKAFIYTTLADVVPALKGVKHTQGSFILKALEIIDQLDFSFESGYRTEFLLRKLHANKPIQWKERITKEFKKTINSYHNKEAMELQRRLIDHAYQHDSAFAKSLVNLLDDEEVRMEYRRKRHLRNYFDGLGVKKQIAEDKLSNDKVSSKMFANACYGSLGALNSSKIATKKYGQIREFLDFAFKLPTVDSYPIYSYYIQNIIKKQEDTAEANATFRQMVDSIYGVCKFLEVIVQKYKSESELDSKIDLSNASSKLFKAGEREKAFKYIRNWIEINFDSYLKICDPYFSTEDLDLLTMIIETTVNPVVSILTSSDAEGNKNGDLYQRYLDGWKLISDQEPPPTRISIVKYKRTGKSPFHDRWLITGKAGLHIGASFNGIGILKASQITELELAEKLIVEREVFDVLFDGRKSEFNGERIERFSFDLT